jgi:short-subunit dehydrogenase
MDLEGKTALITGASRGLGRHIARALAAQKTNLVLAARSRTELAETAAAISGVDVKIVATDVARRADLEKLAATAGAVDVLVNNAGIEIPCEFHRLPLEEMDRMLAVNLVSALTLTRLLVPGMLERKRGHIVNMASMAGKSGPPLAETYAVTKAGLIALVQSLRASYDGTGVSASAICPGFITDAGMFADRSARDGVAPPKILGSSKPEDVARAVVRAIRKDLPEVIVNPGPTRLMAAMAQLFPRLPGWFIRRTHLRELYQKSAPTS